MKKLYTLLLAATLFTACKKAELGNEIIVDPPFPQQISSDTLTSGQLFGLTIGQASADVYAKLQEVQAAEKIGGLSIVKNVYTSIDSLKTRLPLYTGIFMDEERGTSTGVQLSFENNKVKAMFLNDGTKLVRWPFDTGQNSTIYIGDAVEDIYQKLVNIKKNSASAKNSNAFLYFLRTPIHRTIRKWAFRRNGTLYQPCQPKGITTFR